MPDIGASVNPPKPPATSESKDTAKPEMTFDEGLVNAIQKEIDELNGLLATAAKNDISVKIEMSTRPAAHVDAISFKLLDVWKQLKPPSIIIMPR